MRKSHPLSKHYPVQLADDIWLLGNYFINLYLVMGKNATALIELGVSSIVDTVIQQLECLNVAPDYLVLTHPHTDHITGMPGLIKKYPSAQLVAGIGAQEFAQHPKAIQNMVFEDNYISNRLEEKRMKICRHSFNTLPFPEKFKTIQEPEDIDLGDITLNCFPTKGHSPGNISVFVPERKALLASDSI